MITIYSEENKASENGNRLFERVAQAAFTQLGLSGEAAVELIFMPADEMRALNGRTRGVDRVTDVLSYPALREITPFTADNYPLDLNERGEVTLGSIVICPERAAQQAVEYGHSLDRETAFLFLHGLLHLLGYDHVEEREAIEMSNTAETILSTLGLTREDNQ